MPFTRVLIHFVWSTKKRAPLLNKDLREKLFKHLRYQADKYHIMIDTLGGYEDHVHALIIVKHNQSLSDIARLLKGESSHWVNTNNLLQEYFEWQDEYFAVSVSESMVQKVRDYILNQEVHHQHTTYAEEDEKLRKKFGFNKREKNTEKELKQSDSE